LRVRFRGGHRLTGTVRVPGDKSISHRALLIGALAEGTTVVRGLSDGDDVMHTVTAVSALGAGITKDGGEVRVAGGRQRLHPPAAEIYFGNSGTGLRLTAGLVSGVRGRTVLSGDASLSARPMDRIADPLRAMGALVEGRGERCLPPLTVTGGPLKGIDWHTPMASAQVKSAILLAGVSATGETVVREEVATRAHTEEMLAEAGADITVEREGAGRVVRIQASRLEPLDIDIPGDPSQAAFWLVAACLVPGSTVLVKHVYAGGERIGFVGVLQRMGATVSVHPGSANHKVADLAARSSLLTGTVVKASEIPSLDEVPVLAVAASAAQGTTVFEDVGELRVKESDRLAAVAALVRSIGGRAEVVGDELRVHGIGRGARLSHGRSRSGGDHRMAMAAAVAALAAGEGESEVEGFECVRTSYPGFLDDLAFLAGPAASEPPGGTVSTVIAIDGPAGSGKSTVSRLLAERLGVARLDTGAMYRAVAWAVLERGIDPADAIAVAALAADASIEMTRQGVTIDGSDVTDAIRSPDVSRAVSSVAANPDVRRRLVALQRRWAAENDGGVVEGRDIGTVVFPYAKLKVYLTASPEERARRRHDESPEGVARRDLIDSTRSTSPLYKADDARLLDTTDRTVEDVVKEVLSWL